MRCSATQEKVVVICNGHVRIGPGDLSGEPQAILSFAHRGFEEEGGNKIVPLLAELSVVSNFHHHRDPVTIPDNELASPLLGWRKGTGEDLRRIRRRTIRSSATGVPISCGRAHAQVRRSYRSSAHRSPDVIGLNAIRLPSARAYGNRARQQRKRPVTFRRANGSR